MPYGADAVVVGATGGSADSIVVSHTHTATVTDPGHLHTVTGQLSAASNGQGGGSDPGQRLSTSATVNTSTATTGITVANSTTGTSGTGANLPPYLGINFIIKT